MTVTGIPSVADAPPTTTVAPVGKKISDDYGNFLKLFTTQLQNQDPTAPTDTNEMSAQIAQFTQVEQGVQMNQSMKELVDVTKTSQGALVASTQLNVAVQYIGKDVDVAGNGVILNEGDTSANFSYVLDSSVRGTSIEISNKEGKVVYRANGKLSAGQHQVSWDGKDLDGKKVEPGTYTVKVMSELSDGSSKEAVTMVRGTVTASDFADGQTTLIVNDKIRAPLASIYAIYEPKN